MADDPRKVGVYDSEGNKTSTTGTGQMNWWIIALVALVILALLYFLL
jgi:type VI protein secretion system component VasF